MKLIIHEKLNKELLEKYLYSFEVAEDGVYLIEVIAKARSWAQNLVRLRLSDDDLAIKIDGTEFPKKSGKKGLFDAEMAWNGNQLKGLKKTGAFCLPLKIGKHKVEFLSGGRPVVEQIKISKIEEAKRIIYIPTENNPAEPGNRRPWISLAIIGLGIKNLSVKARAGKSGSDDDDIKLIVDEKIEKNSEPKSHKNWFWCGKILKGEAKEFNAELNLKKGLSYIELWADEKPFLERVEVEIDAENSGEGAGGDDPEVVKQDFNPLYVIKDSAFNNCDSMSEKDIQDFIDSYHAVKDKGHISKMEFQSRKVAYWIKKASKENSINPKLLLTKLQAEQRLVKGDLAIAPKADQLDWAMNVGALDDGTRLMQYKGFIIQIMSAAEFFRKYFNEAEKKKCTHDSVDGKPLTVLNFATFTLYRYTPHAAGARLVYDVYKMFFGTADLGGPAEDAAKTKKISTTLKTLITAFAASLFLSPFVYLAARPAVCEKKDAAYLFSDQADLGGGLILRSRLKIFSGRPYEESDGPYCGFRHGKVYDSAEDIILLSDGKMVDSARLTDAELVIGEEGKIYEDNLDYYRPHDIDGDNKKEEFVVLKYAGCNGNYWSVLKAGRAGKKIEEMPVVYEDGSEGTRFYVDIGSESFKYDKGIVSAKYYYNADQADHPTGFYRNYYQFEGEENKFVWFKEEKL